MISILCALVMWINTATPIPTSTVVPQLLCPTQQPGEITPAVGETPEYRLDPNWRFGCSQCYAAATTTRATAWPTPTIWPTVWATLTDEQCLALYLGNCEAMRGVWQGHQSQTAQALTTTPTVQVLTTTPSIMPTWSSTERTFDWYLDGRTLSIPEGLSLTIDGGHQIGSSGWGEGSGVTINYNDNFRVVFVVDP